MLTTLTQILNRKMNSLRELILSKRIRFSACAILVGLILMIGNVNAQEKKDLSTTPENQLSTTNAPVKKEATNRLSNDIIYLPNEKGDLVPVPVNADLKGYLNWLENSSAIQPNDKTAFSISSISINGEVKEGLKGEEFADLNVEFRIQIEQEGWVRVPLKMSEAILTSDPKLVGDGKFLFDSKPEKPGMAWWIKGKGKQTLTLPISVPIRKQLQTRRLVLELPDSLISEMTMSVPEAGVVVKSNERYRMSPVKSKDGKSTLHLVGIGSRLDLSWTPDLIDRNAEAVIISSSEMMLSDSEDSLAYYIEQKVEVKQGRFDTLSIQMPSDFDLSLVEAPQLKAPMETPLRGEQLNLTFDQPITKSVTIRWIFRTERNSSKVQKLSLDGLKIEGAQRQSGEIALARSDSLRFVPTRYRSQVIFPVNLESIQRNGSFSGAYRFLDQPFKLDIDVIPVEPFVRIEPLIQTTMGSDKINLNVKLQCNVYRGAVNELELEWPGLVISDWTALTIGPNDLVKSVDWPTSSSRSQIKIYFNESQEGNFELELSGSRVVPQDEEAFEFNIPRPHAENVLPAIMTVSDLRSVESKLSPQVDTQLLPYESERIAKDQFPLLYEGINRRQYRLLGNAWELDCKIRTYVRDIASSQTIDLKHNDSRFSVSQDFRISISHEPIRELHFKFSSANPIQLKAYEIISGTEKTETEESISVGLSEAAEGHYMLKFTKEILGDIRVEVVHDHQIDNEQRANSKIVIPLVEFLNTPSTINRLKIDPKSDERISLLGQNWAQDNQTNESATFLTTKLESIDSVTVAFSNSPNLNALEFQISKSLIHYHLTPNDEIQGTIQYEIQSAPKEATLFLPTGLQIITLFWNGESIMPFHKWETSDGRFFSLKFPVVQDQIQGILEIGFQAPKSNSFLGTQSWKLPVPHFGPGVWVDQTVWNVNLPNREYLFNLPYGIRPGFQWAFSGLGWQRERLPEVDQFAANIEAPRSNPDWASLTTNSYSFVELGAPREIKVRCISQSLLFLIGSGSMLAIIVLLYQKRARIHLSSLVTISVVVLSLILFFPMQTFLFAQPIVLGVILAFIALAIDRTMKRRELSAPEIVFGTATYQPEQNISSFESFSPYNSQQGFNDMTQHHSPGSMNDSENGFDSTSLRPAGSSISRGEE